MTKVEELRLDLRIASIKEGAWKKIDSLIAAARAEGAEAERAANVKRARKCALDSTFGNCPLIPKIGEKAVPLTLCLLAPAPKEGE